MLICSCSCQNRKIAFYFTHNITRLHWSAAIMHFSYYIFIYCPLSSKHVEIHIIHTRTSPSFLTSWTTRIWRWSSSVIIFLLLLLLPWEKMVKMICGNQTLCFSFACSSSREAFVALYPRLHDDNKLRRPVRPKEYIRSHHTLVNLSVNFTSSTSGP